MTQRCSFCLRPAVATFTGKWTIPGKNGGHVDTHQYHYCENDHCFGGPKKSGVKIVPGTYKKLSSPLSAQQFHH